MTIDVQQTNYFRNWESALRDPLLRAIIAARLFRLANGLSVDVKSVGEGVSEMRINHGPGYRIYFKRCGSAVVVLLCGGEKSSQKNDIKLAKRLAAQWD